MRIPALVLISLAVTSAQNTPTYFARALAGTSSIGDGGQAKAARVFFPSRVTSDAAGNVYVAEAVGRIRKIAVDGTISTYAPRIDGLASGDGGPAAEAGISSLFGLTAAGNFLYVAQRSPCNIRRIDLTSGIISNFAGNGTCVAGPDGPAAATSLNFPGALATDRQGRIYVTEGSMVRRIDPATARIDRFAGDAAGFAGDGDAVPSVRFNNPLGLAVDANNNVYISDTGNCRIRRISATTGLVSTVAGNVICGSGGDGSLAVQAQLSGNGEIALDGTGTLLYIASSAPTVRRLDLSTGIIDRYAGTGVQGAIVDDTTRLTAELRVVLGVHVDAAGNLLFADFGAHRVAKVEPSSSRLTTVAGARMLAGDGKPAQDGFVSRPVEVLAEPGGHLLISEDINRVLRRFSPPGLLSTAAGTGAVGGASGDGAGAVFASVSPNALYRDATGNIYMTDALSNTVRRIGVNGAITRIGPVFPTRLGGVAVDPAERVVYVSLPALHRIARISINTEQASVFAGAGALNDAGTAGFAGDGGAPLQALFNSPERILADRDGALYVVDSGNHRIRKINANGDRIETIAGNGTSDFSGDGNAALDASLPAPIGLALDTAGNLFVNNAMAVFRVDKISGRMHRIGGKTARGNSSLAIPALQASFNGIGGVTVDSRGIVYFAETQNLRVVALTPSTSNTPVITGIIAPGSFGAGTTLTPGGWMEIYGDKLSNVTRSWTNADFAGPGGPTSLSGVSVKVGNIPAVIQAVSPGQVNAVVPDGVLTGNAAIQVTVNIGLENNVTSDAVAMITAPRAPLLLSPPAFARGGKQYVTAVLGSGGFAGPVDLIPGAGFRPARSGERVVLYGIGFGATTPAVAAGNSATALSELPNVKIRLGGAEAQVDYAGLALGFVGLYQFNFRMPSAPSGDIKLEITVDGQPLTQALYFTNE